MRKSMCEGMLYSLTKLRKEQGIAKRELNILKKKYPVEYKNAKESHKKLEV